MPRRGRTDLVLEDLPLTQQRLGAAGEQAATLMRKRLAAGKACIARGRAVEPLPGSMDVLLRGCAEIFTEEPACQAVREAAT